MEIYYNNNNADELAYEHVLTTALNKGRLASQPSLSRFFSRMDETTIKQINSNQYSKSIPNHILI